MVEMEAASAWGIVPDPDNELPDSWWGLPRSARAMMVGYTQLRKLSTALAGFDEKEQWDKYYERKREQNGRHSKGRSR
jgi:hypothetical protein